MVKPIERRSFLKSSAGVVATAAVGTGSAAGLLSRADANDTIRAGVVGLRGRGRSHIKGFAGLPKVEVAALCDVDENIMAERNSDLEKLTGRKARTYTDMRRLLEAKDIDVVGFATPNHWHALGGIWACQAGKGRVRGEALLPQHLGRPEAGGSGPPLRPDRPARHPVPGPAPAFARAFGSSGKA